jgi:DNA-binding SARP family transcriptional activator/DNA-binding XRE family transcriptional regulator
MGPKQDKYRHSRSALGTLIRSRRRERGLTQRSLAELAELSFATIRDLEQGRTHKPQHHTVGQLTKALGLDLTDLSGPHVGTAVVNGATGPVPLRIDVLGPLRVARGDTVIDIRSGRQRALLGLLALAAGNSLSWRSICTSLWPDSPPDSATHLMQTYVAGLRRALAGDQPMRERRELLVSGPHSYRLDVSRGRVDLVAFRTLVAAANSTREGDPRAVLTQYERALDLWRGTVLADVEVLDGHPAAVGVTRERIAATMRYARIGLSIGAYHRILPRLQAIVDVDPLNEQLSAYLMLTLTGNGMKAEAFRHFARVRRQLADEFGVDPDREMAEAYRLILHDEWRRYGC